MDSKALVTGSVGFIAGIVATFLVGFLAMAGMMRGGMMQGGMMSRGCNGSNSLEMPMEERATNDDFAGSAG